jgi:hypothetical protein
VIIGKNGKQKSDIRGIATKFTFWRQLVSVSARVKANLKKGFTEFP